MSVAMVVPEIMPFKDDLPPNSSSLSNPAQTLRHVSKKHADGCLQVLNNEVTWRIYFRNGKLQYAYSSFQSLSILDYHFRCVGFNDFSTASRSLSQAGLMSRSNNCLEPDFANPLLTWLLNHGYLNVPQITQLLENLAKEAIETFLWLIEGHCQWIQGELSSSQDLNLELEDMLNIFQDRIRVWQSFEPLIKSPHQRPYLFSHISENTSSPDLVKLSKLLRGMSIRQLALALNQDELKIAKVLYPYIQRGDVCLRDPQKSYIKLPVIPQLPQSVQSQTPPAKTFRIACVDDSPTILDEMNRFLSHDEYDVTKIDDPVKAASLLFRLKPDLILMDITMPEISGYKLCGLLRNSVALREVPIVMVTGRSGLIDKARAKAAGATDYLVKPFTRGSLLAVVEKYLR